MEIDRIHSVIFSYMNENYTTAIEECDRILEKNGTSYLGRLFRGFAYLKKGLYQDAINDLNEAETLRPKNVEKKLEPEEEYEEGEDDDDDNDKPKTKKKKKKDDIPKKVDNGYEVYFHRGMARFYNENFKEAAADFHKALEFEGNTNEQKTNAEKWLNKAKLF